MVNLEEVLLKIIGELPTGKFFEACREAGLNDYEVNLVLEALDERCS